MIFSDKESFPFNWIQADDKMQTLTESRKILALTTGGLKTLLAQEYGEEKVAYSGRKIARVWSELGWTFTSAMFYQAIRYAKRVVWLNKCLESEEQFWESLLRMQLESHGRKSFRKKNAPRKLKYYPKHRPKIHVWSGISKSGATRLVMFKGIMTATRYGDVLSASSTPFIQQTYQGWAQALPR